MNPSGTALVLSDSEGQKCIKKLTREYQHSKDLDQLEVKVVNNNVPELLEYFKKQSYHDSTLLDLLNKLGCTEEEKLGSIGVNLQKLVEETEKLTGYEYKKQTLVKHSSEQKITKHFAEISETDASDFFANLAKENEEDEPEGKQKEIPQLNNINVDSFQKPDPEDLKEVTFM